MKYLWSTGETTPTIIVNPTEPTIYRVTITDDDGLQASYQLLITPGIDADNFPTSLGLPLAKSYAIKHTPAILRTSMSDGYVRQRNINKGLKSVTLFYLFTEEQYALFIDFYKNGIANGANWFNARILIDGEKVPTLHKIRIQNGQISSNYVATNRQNVLWEISFTADVEA